MPKRSRPLIVGLSLLALAARAAAGQPVDEAWAEAKGAYAKLKADESKRKFRHHWQNVANKYDKVASKWPKSERAPEALFAAAELTSELARFSQNAEDLAQSEAAYRKLLEGWPKHRLAGEAAFGLAHLLADRRSEPAAARKVIEAALISGGGEKKGELKKLLAQLPADTHPMAEALRKASRRDEPAPVAASKKAEPPAVTAHAVASKGRAGEESDAEPGKTHAAKSRGVEENDAESGKAHAAKGRPADETDAESGKARLAAKGHPAGETDAASIKARVVAAIGRAVDASEDEAQKGRAANGRAVGESDADAQKAHAAKGRTVDESDAELQKGGAAKGRAGAETDAESLKARAAAKGRGADDSELFKARAGPAKGTAEAHARRLPPLRPEVDGEETEVHAESAGDGLRLPKLSELQERLRDVRVGARVPDAAEPTTAEAAQMKKRLKQAAREESTAELTLAEQLGLKVRRVVIDAGHGGHDTGAVGPSGVQEKDVALAIALQVGQKLEAAGLEVLLTRDDDTFVRLEDRAKFANQNKGDLFLSIHCNAAPGRVLRGIETYTLNTSADRYSIRLAARENATSERGVSDLQFILADLATKANTEESSRLAQRVQKSLVKELGAGHKGIRDLGTKEALFYVLLGARMPAILVETSFLSNPEEEKLLGDERYQTEVAAAISGAVTGFLEEREAKLARVD